MNTTPHPTTHYLKTWPHHFWPVVRGEKPFEIRKNDRDFKVGDYLALQEYDPALAARAMEDTSSDRESVQQAIQAGYTGQNSLFQITYITDFQQQAGYVVMGIKSVSGSEGKDLTQILEQEQQDLAGQIEIEGVGDVEVVRREA